MTTRREWKILATAVVFAAALVVVIILAALRMGAVCR